MAPEPNLLPLVLLPFLGLVWLLVNRALFRDLFSPFSLVFVSWVAPVVLQTANLSTLETPWTWGSTLLVGWVTFVLVATCLMTAPMIAPADAAPVRATFDRSIELLRSRTVLAGLIGAWVVIFGVYLYVEFITNPAGIPMLSVLGGSGIPDDAIHRWGKDTPLGTVTALLYVFTPAMYLAHRANRGWLLRPLLLAAAISYPVFGVLKLSRSDAFVGGLMIALAAGYYRMFSREPRTRATIVWWAVLGVGGVSLLYAMMSLRLSGIGVTELYAQIIGIRLEGAGPFYGFVGAVYGYLGLPFENLHQFIESGTDRLRPGISVLRIFLTFSGNGGLADRLEESVPYTSISPAAGAHTFLSPVFAEGGYAGAAIVPLLYAGLVNLLYVRMRNQPRLHHVLLYLNFSYPWLWLYFGNAFGIPVFYVNAVFVLMGGLVAAELSRTRAHAPAPAALLRQP